MKALSLRDTMSVQYSKLIADGYKDIETRVWKPKGFVNGRDTLDILICCSAGSETVNKGYAMCVVEIYHIEPFRSEHTERACCKLYTHKHGKPAWAWFLRNRRILSEKFPVKGALNIFEASIPDNIKLIEKKSLYKSPPPIFQHTQSSL